MSEVDVGGMAVEVGLSHQHSITCCWVWQMAAEGHSDRIMSDTEKNGTHDIHWHLLNVYGDQTVDVSTVKQWTRQTILWPCRFLWAWHAGSCSLPAKTHGWWWWLCWKIVFCIYSIKQCYLVLCVVSMVINRRHNFQSSLCKSKLDRVTDVHISKC